MLLLQLAEPATRYTGGGAPKGAVIVTAVGLLYGLPAMLAWVRGSQRRWRITAITLLLGWTVVGWIAALVLTFRYEPPPDDQPDVISRR